MQGLDFNTITTSGTLLIIGQWVWGKISGTVESFFSFLLSCVKYQITYYSGNKRAYVAAIKWIHQNNLIYNCKSSKKSAFSKLTISDDWLNWYFWKGNLLFYIFSERNLQNGSEIWDRDTKSTVITKEESLTITHYSFNSKIIREIEDEIDKLTDIGEEVDILTQQKIFIGEEELVRPRKSLNSIFLPNKESLIKDLRYFLNRRDEYINLGLKWKRIYLFYGVPGSGKTSLAQALAGEFAAELYIVNSIDKLKQSFSELEDCEKKAFFLLEEVDFLVTNRESSTSKSVKFGKRNYKVLEDPKNEVRESFKEKDLRDLLTLLDGLETPDGAVLFLTTNHIDKLDPALIRAGRIDYCLEFKSPTLEQIREATEFYLSNKYPDKVEYCFKELKKKKPRNMAEVQEYLIQEYFN